MEGGDVVWVHDYHLALLPRMLREARGETKVVGAPGVGKHKMLGSEMMVGKGGGGGEDPRGHSSARGTSVPCA